MPDSRDVSSHTLSIIWGTPSDDIAEEYGVHRSTIYKAVATATATANDA